jgi:hypothetical protein
MNSTFPPSLHTLDDSSIRNYLKIFTSSVAVIGILFNILTIIIFISSKRLNLTLMGFHYSLLYSFNNLSLFTFILVYSLELVGIDIQATSSFSCQLFRLMNRVCAQIPPWYQTLVTFDRTISSIYPNKVTCFRLKLNILKVVLFLVTLIVIIASPNYFMYDLVEAKPMIKANKTIQVFHCSEVKKYANFIELYSPIENISFKLLLPVILMLLLNIKLITALIKSKKKLNKKRNLSLKREYQFAFTLIMSNFIFIFSNLPYCIFSIMYHYVKSNYSHSLYIYKLLKVLDTAFLSLSVVYEASSLIYNLKFNKLFRNEFYRCLFFISNGFKMDNNNNNNSLNNESYQMAVVKKITRIELTAKI